MDTVLDLTAPPPPLETPPDKLTAALVCKARFPAERDACLALAELLTLTGCGSVEMARQ